MLKYLRVTKPATMDAANYNDTLRQSIEELYLVPQMPTHQVIELLSRQHFALVQLGWIMTNDTRYDTLVDAVELTVMFVERHLYMIRSFEASLPASQLIRRIERIVNFTPVDPVDYAGIYSRTEWLRKELAEYLFCPTKIEKWLETGQELDSYME